MTQTNSNPSPFALRAEDEWFDPFFLGKKETFIIGRNFVFGRRGEWHMNTIYLQHCVVMRSQNHDFILGSFNSIRILSSGLFIQSVRKHLIYMSWLCHSELLTGSGLLTESKAFRNLFVMLRLMSLIGFSGKFHAATSWFVIGRPEYVWK